MKIVALNGLLGYGYSEDALNVALVKRLIISALMQAQQIPDHTTLEAENHLRTEVRLKGIYL